MRFPAVEGMAHFCWTSTFINIERFKEKISAKICVLSSNLEDRKEFARKVNSLKSYFTVMKIYLSLTEANSLTVNATSKRMEKVNF